MAEAFRCGFVALVGRPNVGKSTLLNRLVGQKISIVTPKAQTTRHRILGIVTRPDAQVILVDTPGLHRSDSSYLNRLMNQAAIAGLDDADLVLFMTEALRWNEKDQRVLEILQHRDREIILVISKIDQVRDKQQLLPFIATHSEKWRLPSPSCRCPRENRSVWTVSAPRSCQGSRYRRPCSTARSSPIAAVNFGPRKLFAKS